MDRLSALRVDLARRSKWNIGYLVAGFVYWSFAAIVGTMLPMGSAKVLWMIGGFTVFPMAIGFSYLLRSDPFCEGNPLGSLMGLAHGGMIGLAVPLLALPQNVPQLSGYTPRATPRAVRARRPIARRARCAEPASLVGQKSEKLAG